MTIKLIKEFLDQFDDKLNACTLHMTFDTITIEFESQNKKENKEQKTIKCACCEAEIGDDEQVYCEVCNE